MTQRAELKTCRGLDCATKIIANLQPRLPQLEFLYVSQAKFVDFSPEVFGSKPTSNSLRDGRQRKGKKRRSLGLQLSLMGIHAGFEKTESCYSSMRLTGGDGIGQPLPPWMRKGGKKGLGLK